jgi:hypothetical protein
MREERKRCQGGEGEQSAGTAKDAVTNQIHALLVFTSGYAARGLDKLTRFPEVTCILAPRSCGGDKQLGCQPRREG